MKVKLICKYCGHSDTLYVYSKEFVRDRKCERCGDKNKILRQEDTSDVFGYDDKKPDDAYIKRDEDE
jgi:DNA replicative helicase MCM subunit Mcm2 (Cdc46/Mcm family)